MYTMLPELFIVKGNEAQYLRDRLRWVVLKGLSCVSDHKKDSCLTA